MKNFDLERYLGKWYTLYQVQMPFQSPDGTDVTATYDPLPNGLVRVVNREYDPRTGQWREIIGTARPTERPGELLVDFPGSGQSGLGGYSVLKIWEGRDGTYQVSIVSDPSRQTLWVLSRSPSVSATLEAAILKQVPPKLRPRLRNISHIWST
jgi:apolipoprotein D and lipocalin family protein